MLPGFHTITLVNRSGLLLGCTGDSTRAAAIGAIIANIWQSHEKCEGAGALSCLLIECEEGRLAIQTVGSFVLGCCSDKSVPYGVLKMKAGALHEFLSPPLSQIAS